MTILQNSYAPIPAREAFTSKQERSAFGFFEIHNLPVEKIREDVLRLRNVVLRSAGEERGKKTAVLWVAVHPKIQDHARSHV
jgi:hypothetical protein